MTTVAAEVRAHSRPQPASLTERIVLAYAAMWIVFLIGGFRMPWEPIPLDDDVTFSLRRQIVFSLGGLLSIHQLMQNGRLGLRVGLHLGWVGLSLGLVASLLWSTDHALTMKRSMVHLFGIALLLATIDMHRRPWRYFLRTVTLAVGACAWISIAQQFLWSPACWSIPWRPGLAGLSGHPNVLGPCMQVGFLLSLALTPRTNREILVFRTMQVGMAVTLFKTDSMTSITSTIAGTAIFFALSTTSYRAGLIQLAVVLGVGVALAIGMDELRAVFFSTTGRDASLSGREHLWDMVLEKSEAHPLLGTGFGAFWYANRGVQLVLTWNPKQAHNSWIDILAELGWIGMVAFVVLVPLRLLPMWQRCAGLRGTQRRAAVAAAFASAIALLAFASRSESFFLRMDKLQWFLTVWSLMLLENRGANATEVEFRDDVPHDKHRWSHAVEAGGSATPTG